MTRSSFSHAANDRAGLYAEVTSKIIAQLEDGHLPWVRPWSITSSTGCAMPANPATDRGYSGINILLLWNAGITAGFTSDKWLTLRQANRLGAHIRKGERGTPVVYTDTFTPKDGVDSIPNNSDDDASSGAIRFYKRYTVFNVDQCDGLPPEIATPLPPLPEDAILPAVDHLLKATGADIRIGGNHAYYNIGDDYIRVPRPDAFEHPINWHRTACHELVHWSGVQSRLARDINNPFGSDAYAFEELVAEIGGAFLCASLRIEPTVRHADYIASWLDLLKNDKRAIFRAASLASKAADYLLGFKTDATSSDVHAAAA